MKKSNRMIRNIIISLTIIISISFTFYGKKLLDNLQQLRISEIDLFTESQMLNQDFSNFQRALGFGGFIHNIKEYLLHRKPTQLIILEANVEEIEYSYNNLKAFYKDNESKQALDSLDQFIQEIHNSYNILKQPENRDLTSQVLNRLLDLESPETLSTLVTLETFKDNYNRRALNNIQASIEHIVSTLLLASILIPMILLIGIYLTYLLNQSYKTSQELESSRLQLLESEEWLEATGRTAKVGGWVLKATSNAVIWTKETYNIFDRSNMTKITLEEFLTHFPEDNRKKLLNCLDRAFIDGAAFELELPYVKIHGDLGFVHIICSPHKEQNRVISLQGTVQDITERKLLEEQLQQAHKMEAIGILAGGIAHDFNNMLSGIMSASQLILLHDRNPHSKSRKYVDIIIEASTRAADLTAQLLNFSGKIILKKTRIDIFNIIDSVLEIMRRTIDKNIIFLVEKDMEQCLVFGDQTSLQNAIMNLCINSSHAMPEGGKLNILVKRVHLNSGIFDSTTFNLNEGDYCELIIKDTGFGISKDYIANIFDPFFTTKEIGKGTGLGLASVYKTIIDHHGSIVVESEIGIGTEFRILIPCVDGEYKIEHKENHVIRGTGLILIVDDEKILRETSRSIIEDLGYSVLLAADGEEAVKIFKKRHSEIALVLLDMIMPRLRGNEVFYRLKEADENCKVIISSGYTDNEIYDELKQAGISGFIHKPYKRYELSQLMHSVLNDNK